MTMNPTTTSPTVEATTRLVVSNNARISKNNTEGGAWLLTLTTIDGTSNLPFVSYRHAHKHLGEIVNKGRIRMVREGDDFTYTWAEAWKG